jgi:WD40 repeat protein
MTSSDDNRRLCPYVGLQPFEEPDREFFFGRERDQRIIISNLLSSPLTILYGSSGVGKSSVLMAGVIPQLRRERPRTPVVIFRNWADNNFQSALSRACIEAVWGLNVDQPKPAETLPFDEVLRACGEAAHETVLVILDQFEEYFLYHSKSTDPRSFEAQFARAVNREDVDIGFLIALRDDGLSKLDRFQERIPNLLSNRLRLRHLDAPGAAAAIRRPLDVWNDKHAADGPPMHIEDDLVNELIQQVQIGQVSTERHGGSGTSQLAGGYIEAPFLQLVMVRLWEEETHAGSNALRRATLDRLKGAKEIVRTHLDDAMSRLEATSQAVCASFFDRLVTPTGSKVACSETDLVRWAGDLAPRVHEVLDVLSRDRILRTVAAPPDNPEATRYEIFHDVLAPAILDWRRRYVEIQERASAVEQAREQAAKRALRQWLFALATMTLVAIVGWGFATWEGFRSKANQKAAESVYTAPFDASRGLDLALEAVQATAPFGLSPVSATRIGLRPTPAAEDALRQAIQASRLEWTLRTGTLTSDIAFSPDGRKLATAGKDETGKYGEVKVWDISSGYPSPKPLILPHKDWVRDVAFLPQGDRLVTAAHDTASLWNLDDPQAPLRSFVQGSPIYYAFAVSRDGSLLATAGNGSRKARLINVWDLAESSAKPEPIVTIDVAGAWVMGLAFSPDDQYLASACVERGGAEQTSTVVYNVKTGAAILHVPLTEPSDAVAFTPDGKSLATASRDTWVRVWQPAGGTLSQLLAERSELMESGNTEASHGPVDIRWSERILAGHGERVRNIAVSPDGSRIASASGDQTSKIWDTETGENLLTLTGHEGYVEAVKFSPDGHHVATASRDRTVKFWNIEGHTSAVTSIAFSPDGKLLATGSSDRTAKLWDLSSTTPRLRHTLRGHTDQIYQLAFNPAGTRLATAGFDNCVKLWNVSSGAEITTLKQHRDQLRGVGFSSDGKHLVSAGADGLTWLYDLESPDIQGTAHPLTHDSEKPWIQASALAFHPQLNQWATGGWDGKLQLWDFLDKKNVGTIELPDGEAKGSVRINDTVFSPDGKVIAALIRRWVYVWPVEAFGRPDARPIATLTMEGAGYCRSIAYSRDGGQLAVACNDASVRLYDTGSNTLVKTIAVHKSAVTDVAFSPDGTKLATASLDKTFYVSPLRFDELYEEARRLRAATSGE